MVHRAGFPNRPAKPECPSIRAPNRSKGSRQSARLSTPGAELCSSLLRLSAEELLLTSSTDNSQKCQFMDWESWAQAEGAARRRQAPLGRRQVAAIPFRPRVASL